MVDIKKIEDIFEDNLEDTTHCEVCHSGDREEILLLCDICNNGYHMDCLTPILVEVPIAEWFCPECDRPTSSESSFYSPSISKSDADGLRKSKRLIKLEQPQGSSRFTLQFNEETASTSRHVGRGLAIPRTGVSERVRARIIQNRARNCKPRNNPSFPFHTIVESNLPLTTSLCKSASVASLGDNDLSNSAEEGGEVIRLLQALKDRRKKTALRLKTKRKRKKNGKRIRIKPKRRFKNRESFRGRDRKNRLKERYEKVLALAKKRKSQIKKERRVDNEIKAFGHESEKFKTMSLVGVIRFSPLFSPSSSASPTVDERKLKSAIKRVPHNGKDLLDSIFESQNNLLTGITPDINYSDVSVSINGKLDWGVVTPGRCNKFSGIKNDRKIPINKIKSVASQALEEEEVQINKISKSPNKQTILSTTTFSSQKIDPTEGANLKRNNEIAELKSIKSHKKSRISENEPKSSHQLKTPLSTQPESTCLKNTESESCKDNKDKNAISFNKFNTHHSRSHEPNNFVHKTKSPANINKPFSQKTLESLREDSSKILGKTQHKWPKISKAILHSITLSKEGHTNINSKILQETTELKANPDIDVLLDEVVFVSPHVSQTTEIITLDDEPYFDDPLDTIPLPYDPFYPTSTSPPLSPPRSYYARISPLPHLAPPPIPIFQLSLTSLPIPFLKPSSYDLNNLPATILLHNDSDSIPLPTNSFPLYVPPTFIEPMRITTIPAPLSLCRISIASRFNMKDYSCLAFRSEALSKEFEAIIPFSKSLSSVKNIIEQDNGFANAAQTNLDPPFFVKEKDVNSNIIKVIDTLASSVTNVQNNQGDTSSKVHPEDESYPIKLKPVLLPVQDKSTRPDDLNQALSLAIEKLTRKITKKKSSNHNNHSNRHNSSKYRTQTSPNYHQNKKSLQQYNKPPLSFAIKNELEPGIILDLAEKVEREEGLVERLKPVCSVKEKLLFKVKRMNAEISNTSLLDVVDNVIEVENNNDRTVNRNINLARNEEVPDSATHLWKREKYFQKLNHQQRVAEEVKVALKPFYNKGEIDKQQYKDIMKRAVIKICRSGKINPTKILALVEAYVKMYIK
ncbi:uncharacterized protein LOC135922251 isoform X3 [Gordionus sp. m RMFG-2023]